MNTPQKRKNGDPQDIVKTRTERTELTKTGHVSCIYQRTKRKPNQMSLDVVLRVRVKERNIFFLSSLMN